MSALLTLEEGAVCEGSMEKLHAFYDRGVRMMTLTWNFPNEIGFPNIHYHSYPLHLFDQVKPKLCQPSFCLRMRYVRYEAGRRLRKTAGQGK